MCWALTIFPIGGNFFYWFLLACFISLIELWHIGLKSIGYVVELRSSERPSTSPPWPIPESMNIPWMWLKTLAQMWKANKWVKERVFGWTVLFGVIVGMPVQHWIDDVKRFNHTRTEQWHVIKREEPFGYTVIVDGKTKAFYWVCKDAEEPKLESGETDNVTLEDEGDCVSLSPAIGMGFITVRSGGEIIKTEVER